jgi:methionyl-tRNA formyltransferase
LFSVVYAGLDIDTWFLLVQEPAFSVRAAAFIASLAKQRTRNPANLLWKRAYRRYRTTGRLAMGEAFVLALLRPLLTSAWRKYDGFFRSIVAEKAIILDFNDTSEVKDFLRDQSIDLLVVNIWDMLPAEIVTAPKYGAVNVHPSELPKYRGAVPTLMTLKNGDAVSAVSYIVLTAGMDDGHLIACHQFPVDPSDDFQTLENKVAAVIGETLISDIRAYLNGRPPKPQDERLASTTPRYNAYRRIYWESEGVMEIYNKTNLYPYLEPFDYCFAVIDSRQLHFRRLVRTEGRSPHLPPGCVRRRGINLYLGATDGVLRCTLVRDLSLRDSLRVLNTRGGRTEKLSV